MDEEGPRQPRRRQFVTALAVALAVAAVPAGVALAGSGGQSSGNEASSGPNVPVQDDGSGGDRNREPRDGHDCPKDRQGNQESNTQI